MSRRRSSKLKTPSRRRAIRAARRRGARVRWIRSRVSGSIPRQCSSRGTRGARSRSRRRALRAESGQRARRSSTQVASSAGFRGGPAAAAGSRRASSVRTLAHHIAKASGESGSAGKSSGRTGPMSRAVSRASSSAGPQPRSASAPRSSHSAALGSSRRSSRTRRAAAAAARPEASMRTGCATPASTGYAARMRRQKEWIVDTCIRSPWSRSAPARVAQSGHGARSASPSPIGARPAATSRRPWAIRVSISAAAASLKVRAAIVSNTLAPRSSSGASAQAS